MKKTEMLRQIVTRQKPLIDVWHYIVGNYRYRLYYKNFNRFFVSEPKKHWLMRQHIYEQINYRIKNMKLQCYGQGSCIKCGCDTTQLQMCNKPCDAYCYPRMLNKKEWEEFKDGRMVIEKNGLIWIKRKMNSPFEPLGTYHKEADKHILYKETNTGYVPYNKD